VKTVDEAIELIAKGQVVEMPDTRSVNTLLTTLAQMTEEARMRGKDAPTVDLCKVTVPGANIFCADRLRSDKHPGGVPRNEMPQLGGQPIPGTEADKLSRTPWDPKNVDGTGAFVSYLTELGIRTEKGQVRAAQLKPSQTEIDGSNVARLMVDRKFDPARNPVVISRDNYIVDGHHRWAAVMGRDAEDGVFGNQLMDVVRVDAAICEVLHLASAWSLQFGIKPKAGVRLHSVTRNQGLVLVTVSASPVTRECLRVEFVRPPPSACRRSAARLAVLHRTSQAPGFSRRLSARARSALTA
jgi:hypothetical protein